MASNELRARLVGCVMRVPWSSDATSDESGEYELCVPPFDTSRDVCAELLEYVRAKSAKPKFQNILFNALSKNGEDATAWDFLTAAPAQITAAFDATFAEELAELESKHGK